MAVVHVNFSVDPSAGVESYDISGMEFLPIGMIKDMIRQGYVGYDQNRADSSLMSNRAFSHIYKMMSGENYDPRVIAVFTKGKYQESVINPYPDMIEIWIKDRFICSFGKGMAKDQNAYAAAKLGRRYGFYLVGEEGGGGPGFGEREINLDLLIDDSLDYDEPELVR